MPEPGRAPILHMRGLDSHSGFYLVLGFGSMRRHPGGIALAGRQPIFGGGRCVAQCYCRGRIGGTSLFAGRGSAWSALLGGLVIGSIANGMDLLALSSSIKFMVTGAVLLLAVTMDAYIRSRRESSGR